MPKIHHGCGSRIGSFFALPVRPFGGSLAQFDFATQVALNPGALYSIELVELTGDTLQMYGTLPGGYPGGTAITGTSLSSVDFFFGDGIQDVPEPGTFGLCVSGAFVLGIGVIRRRRGRTRSTAPIA